MCLFTNIVLFKQNYKEKKENLNKQKCKNFTEEFCLYQAEANLPVKVSHVILYMFLMPPPSHYY